MSPREREHNEVFIGLRIPPSLCGKVDTLAEDENRTRSNMIRRLIEEALQTREANKPKRR